MRQVIRHIILLTSLLLIEVTSSAQDVSTFPVQVTTQVMSPSVYLTDYESGFEERVSVILLNRDVMSAGVDVRLRLTIKCQNGLTLRTKPSAVFEAISLYPGSPERLGMSDLSPYFDVRNLDVNGSLVQGTLPEGLATFTFEAVEYHTGVVVSTQGVAVTNLTMNKPPALLFPMDRSVINSRAARSVLFQWQPRHTYTQEGVTYEITLKEITDTLANPTSAYNYSQSIYQTETTGTSLIYSVSEPPLEAGKRYGWCVRAYRADGTGGSFTNGGYSEVFTFDVRETPLDNQTDVKDSISDTPVKKQEKDYSHCGEDNYRVTNLTPTDALEVGDTITVGGGFNVVLTTLRQSGYLYSGEGYMYIPYVGLTFAVDFNGIKVNTDKQLIEGYTEVRRDASKAQIGGTDAILQGGANRLKNGVLLPDVTVDFNMEDASGADYDSVSNTVTVYDEEGSKVGSFTVPQNETGESVFPVTVKDKAGNIVRIDEETDADGKPTGKYKFTPLGSQSAGQYISEQTLSTLRSDLGSVDFEENADGIYTFDQPLDYYETVSLLLNSDGANGGGRIYRKVSGYDVPWLFIAEGGTESVRAKLTLTKSGKSEIKHPENITFIINDEGGVITLPSEYDAADNTYSVRVSASQADSRQTVYALYQSGDQSHTLGQLDVDTRAPLTAKVCLVNLGGKYDKSRIETNINAIYQRVGVTWSVEEENGFTYPKEKLEILFDKKSGALELYNENQKSLNKAFEAYMGERYDGSTCYVFMMPANGSGSKRDLAGFMPRGEQYGYINTDVILQEQMPAVIAHELGHGKFRLRHTFDSEYGKGAESKKGKTENLMDYAPTPSKATHIAKWQWNQIHNPALLTELWEKDEDSEWVRDAVKQLAGYDYAYIRKCGSDANRRETGIDVVETYKAYGCRDGEWSKVIEITDREFFSNANFVISEDFVDAVVILDNGIVVSACDPSSNVSNICENASIDNKELTSIVEKCFSDFVGGQLKELAEYAPKGQQFEILYNGKAYYLDNGVVKQDNVTDEDIRQGILGDESESKIRIYKKNGIWQLKVVGINKNFKSQNIGVVNYGELSDEICRSTNQWLKEENVTSLSEKTKNHIEDEFPGGEQVQVRGNETFFKIAASGIEMVSEVLRTGEFQQKIYNDNSESIIKLPGLLTGTSEAALRDVTDVTSIVYTGYELVVSEEKREEVRQSLSAIADAIGEDKSVLFKLLADIALEEATGLTSDEYRELGLNETDGGRKRNLGSRGTTRSVLTIVAGSVFVKQLPKVAEHIASKLSLHKRLSSFAKVDAKVLKAWERLGTVDITKVNKNICNILKKEGLTDDDIGKLIKINRLASTGDASDELVMLTRAISEKCFELPKSGQKMNKYVSVESFKDFYLPSLIKVVTPSVNGCAVRAYHYDKSVRSEQLIKDLGLNYQGSPFSSTTGYVKIEFDMTDEMQRNIKRTYQAKEYLNNVEKKLPQTYTGVLGHKETDLIVPEFYIGEKDVRFPLPERTVATQYNANGVVENVYELIEVNGKLIWISK